MSLSVLVGAALRALFRLPRPLQRLMAGAPRRVDGQTLDLQIQLLFRLIALTGSGNYKGMTVQEARADMLKRARLMQERQPQLGRVETRVIPGPGGPLRVRIYSREAHPRNHPMLTYYHGGGGVLGDIDSHDSICRHLAWQVPCIVVSVDYRLAPENKFPCAVDDALAGFRWTAAQAGALGGDPERVAVAGDSAGGNLAAVVAQRTSREEGPRPVFQLLIYPNTDMLNEAPSFATFADGFALTREKARWFGLQYLRSSKDRYSPDASPLLAPDLSGLPPAHVMTAGFDLLRDEGRAYADRLSEAGVPVTYHCYEHLPHAFLSALEVFDSARQAFDDACVVLRQALCSDPQGH